MRATRRPTLKPVPPPKPPAPPKKKPAAKKPDNTTRKISAQRRLRPFLRRAVAALILLCIIGFAGAIRWAWQEGWFGQVSVSVENTFEARLAELSFALGLELKHIEIEGHRFVTKETILNELNLKPDAHYAMLTLSGEEIAAKLSDIQFIRNVAVEKHFPDTIVLHITEREPVAIWQYQGELSLIDVEGVILQQGNVEQFWKLPVLVGQDAVFHAKTLLDFLISEEKLFEKVTSMTLIGSRRWDIRFENGKVAMLPEDHPEKAWAQLAELEKNQQLLEKQIKIIDLRVPGQVYILPIPPTLPEEGSSAAPAEALETPDVNEKE